MPIVRFEHVSQTFEMRRTGLTVQALSDVTFDVEEKEFCAIVGPSGCGKSTLLSLLAGLKPPSSGNIYFRSNQVEGINTAVGYVTQDSRLLPWMSVIDNIRLPLDIRHVPRKERDARVEEWISLVGLEGFESVYPSQLSGGMQKRCSIARTLVYDPEVVLMDEPFAAVDAITRTVLQQILLDLWSNYQKTVIFVTHDLNEALTLADRVVVMTRRPGRIKAELAVPISRPRDVFHVAELPEFAKIHRELWEIFRSEIGDEKPDSTRFQPKDVEFENVNSRAKSRESNRR
jgi:NitT/TauT family transport system ATP-binding protein